MLLRTGNRRLLGEIAKAQQRCVFCTKVDKDGEEKLENDAEKTAEDSGKQNLNFESLNEDPMRGKLQEMLRSSHAAETAAVKFFEGQNWALEGRPDVQYFLDQERQKLQSVKTLAINQHARPSALTPVLELGGFALGIATALAPRRVSMAVIGALDETFSESYNDQIRELGDGEMLEKVDGLRDTLRDLRDTPRAPEGAPSPPDISKLNKLDEVAPEDAIGAAVKTSCQIVMSVTGKV